MGATLAPGTVLHGRYSIDALVQVGREGALYRGSDALAAAKIVLIRENADPSPEAQARFRQEAEILAGLEHPSLPVVLDSFVEPSGRQYLVLLGFAAPDLGAELAQKGAMPEAQVLTWFGRLLDAVAHLHAQHPPILHGHISPAKIVITADGTPHLTDLADVEDVADAGAAEAKAPFLAPEQLSGYIDERSDVYGLGATLYVLLTGKAPVDAKARAGGTELVAPHQVIRSVSAEMEAAILKAMALDPDQRFTGPAQIRQALDRVSQPGIWVGAAAPDRPPASPKRRALALGGVGILAALVAGAVLWRFAPPNGNQTLALAPTPMATATTVPASPTPEATATPVATATVPLPTATKAATATTAPTLTPTAAPTAVPTRPAAPPPPAVPPTARWFPGPTASATPRWFPAPSLVYPNDAAVLEGPVEFRWSWPYALADDEYFDVQVYRIGQEPKGIAWSKQPFYSPITLFLGEGQYQWRVRVIRGTNGQVQGAVSDPSPERGFTWKAMPTP